MQIFATNLILSVGFMAFHDLLSAVTARGSTGAFIIDSGLISVDGAVNVTAQS